MFKLKNYNKTQKVIAYTAIGILIIIGIMFIGSIISGQLKGMSPQLAREIMSVELVIIIGLLVWIYLLVRKTNQYKEELENQNPKGIPGFISKQFGGKQ